jgi:protein-disulfide isomerase
MARDTNMMNKGTAIVGFVLSFVTGAGFMYAVDRGGAGKGDLATADKAGAEGAGGVWKQDAPVPVSSDDPSEGPKTALVTIVEFSDYQ